LGVGDITIDITSLVSNNDELVMAGSVIVKCLYYGIDEDSSSSYLSLTDVPSNFTLKISQGDGGFIGSHIGNQGITGGTGPAMCPLYLSSSCGLRLTTSIGGADMCNVTYVEMEN
jgi:hypothetical protein